MPRHPTALALALLAAAACDHRLPVSTGDVGPMGGDAGAPDLAPVKPDEVCKRELQPLSDHLISVADLRLALPARAAYRAVAVAGKPARTGAAIINIGAVAGFAAALPMADRDPATALAVLRSRLATLLGVRATLSVRGSGTSGRNHAGLPDVKEALWDIDLPVARRPDDLRSDIVAAFLGRTRAALPGLAGPAVGVADRELTVELTLVLRPGQAAVTGAVVRRADYERPGSGVRGAVEDLGNGTALARAAHTTRFTCDDGRITARPRADIIWVVDESGSMNDNREDIVRNAAVFFNKARAAGLDFRIGVTGMKNPQATGAGDGVLGKLCSRASTDPRDDGGDDRFLLPSEQQTFIACVRNPPYYEGGSEYGLSNAFQAVARHLPRAASDPRRIRTGAEVTLIIATDETPQELKSGTSYNGVSGFLAYVDYRSSTCTLSSDKQSQLARFLAPWVGLFSGVTRPDGAATVHVLGGICGNRCRAEVAHGYRELARRFGGQVGDICQDDLGATLQVIVDSIVAAASPRVLRYRPISSSLVVVAGGQTLRRSGVRGFTYSAARNALSFINVKVRKGDRVVAAYRRFVSR